MASLTAIELGADTCVFARTAVRRGEVHLSAAEILDPAGFPGADAFAVGVGQIRRSLHLPRRCSVVLWGLPDGATRKDAAVKPLLAPLTSAGFRVDRVVSPCNALAALARLKTSRFEGSTCWVAINRGGVAIVVVRPGKLLYAHSFAWDSTIGASGSQARLLQRYSLVSFLSPEVKRAMAEARKSGTPVYAVVTCGNLPELRSLTMPLIEELDVEVETLDSFEGLVVKPAVAEKLSESASAIRLACAGAIARGTRPWDPSKKRTGSIAVARYARAAVFAAVVAGVAYAWYARFAPAPAPAPVVIVPAKPATPQPRAQIQTPIRPPVVSVPAPVANGQSASLPPKGGDHRDGTGTSAPALSAPAPAVSVPAKSAESNPKKPDSKGAVSAPATKAESTPPPVVTTVKTPPVTAPPPVVASKTPVVTPPASSAKTLPPPVVTTFKTPPAVSVPAKKPESNPLVTVPAPKATPPVVAAVMPPVVSAPPPAASVPSSSVPPKGGNYRGGTGTSAPAPSDPAKKPVVSAPPPAASVPPSSVPPKGGNYRGGTGTSAPALSDPAKKPVVSAPPPAASVPSSSVPPKGGNYRSGTGTSAPALSAPAPAVTVPAKGAESNPKKPESKGAVSVPAKRPESNPPVTATNTVPRTPMLPLITLPRPNLPAPSIARTTPPATVGAARPAASVPEARTPPLISPAIPADKPEAGTGAPRGPLPALLKDAVPKVTAILVSRDRRFATVDGGQIIGIGDLLGRRTVVGMDERSVVLQEPSGVQIRVGLGGRLLGIERAAR